ncbi:MAG: T9SS type A sorting domain-containing protein [Flavobacterium sp.]|uniref:T9SS type A sorting domain-containing protein n=1 Tax=Flavobacterium sp. TaxID=239 RepID=UPI0022C06B0C|nr:T9SS type A sorting domain-containing protein [Flavobacterium sp.]MCZ8197915.1 T9SS type A sorting domain-containing protein [Flavobacterium sp.]
MKKNALKRIILLLFLLNAIATFSQCWKQVSAGNNFTLAIKNDGTLWAWGRIQGDYGNQQLPIQIGTDTDWKFAEAASEYTLVIKNNGTLWGWGKNPSGQLGNGTQTDVMTLTQIGSDTDWESISAYYTTLALKTDGTLWVWGGTNFGLTPPVLSPQLVGTTSDHWKSISSHNGTYAAIKVDGTLWFWGNTQPYLPSQAQQVTSSITWDKVVCGAGFRLALKTDGTLWSWGYNFYGQLGQGNTTDTQIVTQIGLATDWKDIAASYIGSFAQKIDGSVWSWGLNASGQLGYGFEGGSFSTPAQVGIATDVKTFDAGEDHIMYLKNDDSMWVCGSDYLGQLGNGNSLYSQATPIAIACAGSLATNDFVANELSIFPNPTTGIVIISNEDNLSIDKIEILDILGKTVSVKTNNTSQVDISHLSNGIYIFKIYSGETVFQKKIIKQ